MQINTNGDHMIDLNEWMKFTNTHKRIMVPLIKAQSNLKQRVMGRFDSISFESFQLKRPADCFQF